MMNEGTKLGLPYTTLGSTWPRISESLLSLAESRIHQVHWPLVSLSPRKFFPFPLAISISIILRS